MNNAPALRKLLCLTLALTLLLSTALPCLAETYEVGTAQQLSDSWNAANANSDSLNTFNMTQNIDMDGYGLYCVDNKSYVIDSVGNADYTISNVTIAEAAGNGSSGVEPRVTIRGDVSDNGAANSDTALYATGDVTVVVTGDVTVDAKGGGDTTAVAAQDGAFVVVMGDVASEEDALYVQDPSSSVEVYGDVTAKGAGDQHNDGIMVIDEGWVYVGGNVSSADGVYVTEDSSAVFARNVTLSDGEFVVAEKADATVKGNLTVGSGSVDLHNGAALTVNKDLNAKSGVVSAANGSKMELKGHMETVGVNVDNQSVVTVHNGITTEEGTTDGNAMDPFISVQDRSELHVYGETESGRIDVNGSSKLYTDGIDADTIHVGNYKGKTDRSELKACDDVNADLYVYGNSDTVLMRNLNGHLLARNNAKVDVWLDISYLPEVYDNAVVREHTNYAAYPHSNTYYNNSAIYADANVVDLCVGYGSNSPMMNHVQELENLMASASMDLVPHLNGGNGLIIGIVEMFDMTVDEAERLMIQYDFSESGFHSDSVKNMENTEDINTLLIETHKKTLAKALQNLSEDAVGQKSLEDNKKMFTVAEKFHNFLEKSGNADLSNEEKQFFKNALNNEIFSDEEAREFLIKFGGYTKGERGIGSAVQELRAMVESMKSLDHACKALGVAYTFTEFVNFFNKNYTNQVAVLDNMLLNQSLSPEMLIAVYELRSEYNNHFAGGVNLIAEEVKEKGADKLKDVLYKANPTLMVGYYAVELLDAVGTFDKQHAIHDAAALVCSAPEAIEAYKNAILNVQNGNRDEEALQMVRMTYAYAQSTISALCDAMTKIGDKEQRSTYEKLKKQLDELELGDVMKKTETIIMADNYDKFYMENIDPNAPVYRYA